MGIGLGALDAGLSVFNTVEQVIQNRKDRKFQQHMYDQQRSDALTDAAYNSPTQQMRRLSEAGLNPNLVYGKGADGVVAQIRGSSPGGGNQPAPQVDSTVGTRLLMTMLNAENTRVQTDNLYAQKAVIEALAAKYRTETDVSKFGLQRDRAFFPAQLSALDLENRLKDVNIQKVQADTQFTLDSNERAQVMNAANVKKTLEEILNLRSQRLSMAVQREVDKTKKSEMLAQIDNIKSMTSGQRYDNVVKAFLADMASSGINPHDPAYIRNIQWMINQILSGAPIDQIQFDKNANSGHGVNSR